MTGALLAYVAAAAMAQSDSVSIRTVARDTSVAIVATAAGPAVRAAYVLPLVGVRVTPDGRGRWTLTRGTVSLTLVDGMPFATDRGVSVPIAAPPLNRGGELLLPLSTLGALAPHLGSDLHWNGDRRELRMGTANVIRLANAFRADVHLAPGPRRPSLMVRTPRLASAGATFASVASPAGGTGTRAAADVPSSGAPTIVYRAPTPIDVPTPRAAAPPARAAAATTTAKTDARSAARGSQTAAPRTALRTHRVVVDAGHGGPDNGMKGPLGGRVTLYEKDITLAVSKRLAAELETRGLEVVMTRTTDTLIALPDRGRIANQRRGDLFISVHVNAANPSWKDPAGARGFETYFLSDAKTEDERRVAQIENASEQFDSDGDAGKSDPLGFLIADMKQNEYLRESSDLAAIIQARLRTVHPGPSRGVKQAGFRVLVTSFMPSVLVEIGFGSNPSEAAFISSAEGQREIAAAVADAAVEYLAHYERRAGAAPAAGRR